VLADVSPDVNLATSPFISRTTGEPIAMATGSTWAIPVKAKNKAAACRFISAMTETDSWIAAAQARADLRAKDGKPFTGLLTGNDTADQKIREQFVKPTGSDIWDQAIESMYTANDNLFYLPAIPADQEFRQAWIDGVNRVLSGDMTAQQSLDKAQEEGQKALDTAWAKLDTKG
jgi:multiple sugar transport system substrate-binding protein